MSTVWSLTGRIAYTDGSNKSVAVVKDSSQPSRMVGDDDDGLLAILAADQKVKDFVTAMGYTASTAEQSSDVRDVVFRFMSIATDAGIYVIGSNTEMGANVESNDLDAALALLNQDSSFVELMGTELA